MAKNRVTPRVSAVILLYLEDLKATGLYGNSIDGVARTLIEQGIRQAIASDHINARQFASDDSEEG